MGVNNRQRRAAKQRKRAKTRGRQRQEPKAQPASEPSSVGGAGPFDDPFAGLDDRAIARNVIGWVGAELPASPHLAAELAAAALETSRRIDGRVLLDTIREWLAHIVTSVVAAGWTPTDLTEVVRRRGQTRQLPVLSALLHAETERHRSDRVSTRWVDDLGRLPQATMPDLGAAPELENVFALVAVLIPLPNIERTIPPPGSAPQGATHPRSGGSSKHLSRVRALLAKAESTESPEEAEALSAKAQELISRYALARLLDEPDGDPGDVTARRIWIDAPYIRPKATLINAIAGANRCRSVFTEGLEFMTVIGELADIEAIELMTASLLVQAQSAMIVHGSQIDRRGTSRTRSFRQSFLVSYASRIGERLHEATEEAVEESGHAKALVPVLRRRAEQVDAARDAMFPQLHSGRLASVSNGAGWAAGRAAADLANLDAHRSVTAESGP